MTKQYLLLCIIGVLVIIIAGYFLMPRELLAPAGEQPDTLVYTNTEYGFSVALPQSWEGYTVSMDTWTGNAINDQLGEEPFATGTVVSIHNPLWTPEVLYQDIPVMVFTHPEWEELQRDEFHIGAAPINPRELGRNADHVFALPARYNFAFPPGWEEVEAILNANAFTAF